VSLHRLRLCKVDPDGLRQAETEDGPKRNGPIVRPFRHLPIHGLRAETPKGRAWHRRGARSDKPGLSDSDRCEERDNRRLARALRSGLPGAFFPERSGVKKA